jgi:hypothetical protein
MNINVQQLELNVNLHAIQPEFLNLELHYVIAENENTFRFTEWSEQTGENEKKFYCFLQQKELLIPAGDILLKESYVITEQPIYPVITDCKDLVAVIKTIKQNNVAKAIRNFSDEAFTNIKNDLSKEFSTVETHEVKSPSLQHHIFVVDDIEISVAPTMVYVRSKAPFSERHYQDAANKL